jgi:MoxR-like ATPase
MGLGYTTPAVEREIVTRKSSDDPVDRITPVLNAAEISALKSKVDQVTVEESIVDYIMQIVSGTRESRLLRLGAGPRGGMALHRCARAMAVIRGRDYVLVDDVKQLAVPALAHRVVAEGAAAAGNKDLSDRIIGDIVSAIDVPV